MQIKFFNYNDDTQVYVAQDTFSKSTSHIGIENEGTGEAIYIYMPYEKVQGFINKLQSSLDEN